MTTKEIINWLQALDLKKATDDDVRMIVGQFGKIAVMSVTLHEGSYILRGRADMPFINRKQECEISYIRGKNVVPDYNRGSFAGVPMFYGSTSTTDENYCQVMAIYEITNLLGDQYETGDDFEEYITMGKWRVKKDIHLAVVAHHSEFHAGNEKLKNLHEDYLKFISRYPESVDHFLQASTYIASEFAKEVKPQERYNYKISAAFNMNAINQSLDGTMYPTAKDQGKGFNVAITPEAIDSKAELERVVVWRLRKRNKKILMEPYLYCGEFNLENGCFIWKDANATVPPWVAELKLSGL
jgi:hypothetical protein